ncbi:mercuric reductase [bacterium]|nr:mercuric reductase [bacterium]
MNTNEPRLVLPVDKYNLKLLAQVRPTDYVNPAPSGRYNMVVIGGGTAGLATAMGAAGLGAKVALVEKQLLGGDSLNAGCVPSKALIRSARAAAELRDAAEYGMKLRGGYEVDFAAVMERMRRLRAEIAPVDGVKVLTDKGVDVFLGNGSFLSGNTVDVEGTRLEFARAVIATGTRAAVPSIPGIEAIEILTNENLFWLTELPKRLAVIGSGSTGAEMAQAFARFGSKVTVYDIASSFMPKEDRDASAIVRAAMAKDGVGFRLGVKEMEFSRAGDEIRIRVIENGHEQTDAFDKILMATGRVPNTEGLNLEGVGVKYDESGVVVNDRLCTTNSRIFACGDVASEFKYTHAADALARIVIGNALFFGTHPASQLNIPWTTFTDPEIAHVGVYGHAEEGQGLETMHFPFTDSDRAVLDGQSNGMIKLHIDKKGNIKGATIAAANAGEIIGEIVMAMNHRIKLGSLASDIHPYPTQSEIIKKCGDTYRQTMLTPTVEKFLKKLLKWRR